MKKQYISMLLLGALAFGSGCDSVLDIKPLNEISADQALNTAQDVEALLMMSYAPITSGDFLAGAAIRTSELYADNINPIRLNGDDKSVYQREGTIFNGVGRGLWASGYTGIYRANLVIRTLDEKSFPEATSSFKQQLKGEAFFLRAIAHFELVRLYAKPYTSDPANDPGIPIRTIGYVKAEEAIVKVPRDKVGQVYGQVISDLKAAIDLLPESNGNRATKWAAKAYLARVYFNQENYGEAYNYANDVIENSGIKMDTLIRAPFNMADDNTNFLTRGVVFQVVSIPSNDASGTLRGSFWNAEPKAVYMPLAQGVGSIYSALTTNGGDRLDSLTVAGTSDSQPYASKFQGTTRLNIPIIRLAEMYLTRAEAGLNASKITAASAASDVNVLRKLAGLPDLATASLSDIQAERRVEFFMEGDRFHELRRLKQSVRGEAYNSSKILLKIPDSETSANANIEQN